MSDIAIRVEGISKQFQLGKGEQYRTLRDTLTDAVKAPFRRFGSQQPQKPSENETLWALKDVSFEVKHGEVLGIIGRNGAGKSTLLKLLSRITEPTMGRIQIHGRVGSLLEVGTGFHPELSGRENIFLNGAILGMKKSDIANKFDEIVAFAEVERFVDTPVKHYSSGMYTRLAFAVAAHMEPDILIIDEVLAVGDQKFQEKCLSKMDEVGRQGRTVFFVSHSMSAIQRLCRRVLVLEGGRLTVDGDTRLALREYLSDNTTSNFQATQSSTKPSITSASVTVSSEAMIVQVKYATPSPIQPILGFVIYDETGTTVFGTNSKSEPLNDSISIACGGSIEVKIPTLTFRPGRYFVSLWLTDAYEIFCHVDKQLQIEIPGVQPELPLNVVGSMRIPVQWCFEADVATNVRDAIIA